MSVYRKRFNPIKLAPELREKYTQRFWSRVLILGPDECWPWQHSTDKYGYGKFHIPGQSVVASRFAYFATHGKDPDDCAMHTCDNPPCCNPGHIKSGTYADNNGDMARKGRNAVGSRHPFAVLTEQIVVTGRELRAQGVSVLTIAKMFNVHRNTMRSAIEGATWKHI